MEKYAFIILLVICYVSCKNQSDNNSSSSEKEIIKEQIKEKEPELFPSNLKVTSKSHDVILNTNLFSKYSLLKGETAEIKNDIGNANFPYYSNFIELLPKSKFENPKTYGAEDVMKLDISFECTNCYDATVIRFDFNSKELSTGNDLKEFLEDPSSIDRKIKNNNGVFNVKKEITLRLNGLIGIYLVLRNSKKELFIYEIIGLKSDGVAPLFRDSEYCSFNGDEEYEGMVCITTKQFEGNDYSGYSVPLKGKIYGDVASININGKNVKFKKGEFYKRMHMMLKTGYNQIPVVVKDKYSNKTETYMEVILSRIKDEPDIYIDNDIDIEN